MSADREQELRYALAKQVPDMAGGFVVATSYGDIYVPPGVAAGQIQAAVERALSAELKALARRQERAA